MHDSIIPGTTYPYGVNAILGALRHERQNQDEKWGEQNHPIRWPETTYEDRLDYLAQAELWKKANAVRVRSRRATPPRSEPSWSRPAPSSSP